MLRLRPPALALALVLIAGCEAGRLEGYVKVDGLGIETLDAGTAPPPPPSAADAGAARPDAGTAPPPPAPDAGQVPAPPVDAGQAPPPPSPDAGAPPAPVCGDGVCTAGAETCSSCEADCGPCNWPAPQATEEDEMLVLVNALRAEGTTCGGRVYAPVGPLEMSPELRTAARDHSQDMADQNYFDHQSLDGRSPWDRIRAAGYPGSPAAENIAAGNSTAEATFGQWHRSAGHCANMMSSNANQIGIGYAIGPGRYRHYWTQAFGRGR
jgi:uncharacterized protein YkwD